MKVVHAKDFPMSSFQVAINRIQQVALEKAKAAVPCPEDQLALIATKKGKLERLSLSLHWAFQQVSTSISHLNMVSRAL